MKIGILQAGHVSRELREKHGEFSNMFEDLLAEHEFTFETYNVVDDAFPKSIDCADGWLVTGSAHGVYEPLPWITKLEHFLHDAYFQDIPIVGICFGHQILAKALGGEVEKFNEGWAIGNQTYEMLKDQEPNNIIAWHQDQVTVLPPNSKAIGNSDFCKNAFIIYGRSAYTIQAHPEFLTEFGEDLTRLRKKLLPKKLILDAETSFKKPLSTKKMANQIASFFKTQQLT